MNREENRKMNEKSFNIALCVNEVRAKRPLVHHLTNYVTVNDCANITLGIGGSPIMADDPREAADITGIASSLVINMGTLNERTVPSMILAGKAANEKGIPVIFDPVGAGASAYRNETAAQILDKVSISVLRGNISEIRYIAGLSASTKGVDAAEDDHTGLDETGQMAKRLAAKLDCTVAITGAVDVVSDGQRVICIENGHPMLSNLTGTGCMCSSLMGAYCGAAPGRILEAVTAALLSMGIAGEMAYEAAGSIGNGSFRVSLLDTISHMSDQILAERGRFYEA